MKKFSLFLGLFWLFFFGLTFQALKAQTLKKLDQTKSSKIEVKKVETTSQKVAKPLKIEWLVPKKPILGETDPVPSDAVKLSQFKVELKPGEAFEFYIPLQTGGTEISVKFVPENITLSLQKPRLKKVPVSEPQKIENVLQSLIQEQNQQVKVQDLSFVLLIENKVLGQKTFYPEKGLSSRYKFWLKLGSEFSVFVQAKGVLKNQSANLIKGTVYVSSTDHTKKVAYQLQKQQKEIEEAIENTKNPEMLWIVSRLLKRHLKGYPGGQSEFEESFAKNLSSLRVPQNLVVNVSDTLVKYENKIQQKVVDKEVLKIEETKPVKRETVNKFLKIEKIQTLERLDSKVDKMPTEGPRIHVIYPNGEETWEEGKTYSIRWENVNYQQKVKIILKWEGGQHTITDIPNTGSYVLTLPKLSNQKELRLWVGVFSVDEKIGDWSDRSLVVKKIGSNEKYRIRLLGIMSHRCADDEGWERGCDDEEPYVVWAAFGPTYESCGRTDEGKGVGKGDTWLFSKDVNVYGGGGNKTETIEVNVPLIFLYMVLEKDSGSPSRDEIVNATTGALSLAKAIYDKKWDEAIKNVGAIWDTIVIFQKIAAKSDDLYPPYLSYFDHQSLLQITPGNGNPPPMDRALLSSVGNYDHLSIRRADIYKDPVNQKNLQWSVFYMVIREETGY